MPGDLYWHVETLKKIFREDFFFFYKFKKLILLFFNSKCFKIWKDKNAAWIIIKKNV